ncbi:uncharacterized protein EI90DRAFT_3130115 [Cantharellus anzutake]|uniref:uncharacterized protein n=1 Tax=Cantharellus anzutake TaxID=1750568 RepID=UPI0019085305|nr:uncharacterized protein EI90DRAFT_3130115 [Cantharellus anzutake]KAF8324177.1 hypothetical protein EI90DRAFT_3130115 [Cantharellus anzutake]
MGFKVVLPTGSTRIVNLAYDNCDFKFGVGQPTDLKDRTFESITTGLFFAPPKEVLPEHLEYAESIWDSHPNNPNAPNVPPMITFADVLPTPEAAVRIMAHCRWHITSVLIEEHFPELRSHLLDPPSTFQLSPQQMLYSTAEAVYAKASTIDGNIDAIMSLLQQSGIVEVGVFEKYVILGLVLRNLQTFPSIQFLGLQKYFPLAAPGPSQELPGVSRSIQ